MVLQNSAILSRNQFFVLIPKHVSLVYSDQPLQHPSSFAQRIVALDACKRAFSKLNTQTALADCKQCDRLTHVRFVADKEN